MKQFEDVGDIPGPRRPVGRERTRLESHANRSCSPTCDPLYAPGIARHWCDTHRQIGVDLLDRRERHLQKISLRKVSSLMHVSQNASKQSLTFVITPELHLVITSLWGSLSVVMPQIGLDEELIHFSQGRAVVKYPQKVWVSQTCKRTMKL